MSIDQAIEILCRVHVASDYAGLFSIKMGATPGVDVSETEYVEAWAVLVRLRAVSRGPSRDH